MVAPTRLEAIVESQLGLVADYGRNPIFFFFLMCWPMSIS